MRELALHLLDIMENSVRAGARRVRVSIVLDDQKKCLALRVDDDGPGLPVNHDAALNPFFTTKSGKRTGLGLSLFQEAAERAGGRLSLENSPWGGLGVVAIFEYGHIDRTPLGNVPDTMMTLILTNPDMHLECEVRGPGGAAAIATDDVAADQGNPYATALDFADKLRAALNTADIGG